MAEELRRSKRGLIAKRDSDYEYDEKVLSALTKNPNCEISDWQDWQQCDSIGLEEATSDRYCVESAGNTVSDNSVKKSIVLKSNSWSDLITNIALINESAKIPSVFNLARSESTQVQSFTSASGRASSQNQNINSDAWRRGSSTTDKFLDPEGNNFLTMSEFEASSDGGSNKGSQPSNLNKLTGACALSPSKLSPESPSPTEDDGLTQVLEHILQEIKGINKKVNSVETMLLSHDSVLENFKVRIDNIEVQSSKESAAESSSRNSSHGSKKSKQKPVVENKPSAKSDRVEFEKNRGYKVLLEKMKDRNKCGAKNSSESSSDEEPNMAAIKKKMSKKQRDEARRRSAALLKQAGSTFPVDEDESNCSAGTGSDSDNKIKLKGKVKSGAKVRNRPVVRTELWPHTIANEDDNDDSTSESISLSKFLACFTYIMTSCEEPVEALGRGLLLHAISSVFEYLPWAEARAFHNLVMIKVEQGRIDWNADFPSLANDYIDKKVRQSLRSRSKPTGSNSYSRGNFRGNFRGFGKGYGNASGKSSYNRSSPTYNSVCKQWNQGTCSYGDDCRRQHVCWTCHEAGKTDQHHKASTHGTSSGNRQSGQQT